ncbi:capsular biosynthesis protein [Caloranaerobacter sp. TR13]|uniref:CpsD/CapB family tyrosine-protein kinase n=1 Tax=Caloranaerobacter sp. TR13 TaxID=1302151 RepID=UPI0006D48706|nr:CpsD/CapB family tyrosine-protein kinase [Caloranaerobacter sp. TR13]KPU27358.1 capsular biosynthesis protein [Caloranaerobacter sp. TR13]
MDQIRLVTQENPKSPVAEAFRTLRTNIQFSNVDKELKSILITSPGPGEGKSTTIVNLAVTMAQNDKRVLLIDCDLRKPRIHKNFGISNSKGLTTILSENIDYKEILHSIGIGLQLDVLTSGPIPPNPSELLGTKKMKAFLEKVEADYDIVLIDSPPVGMVTDAAVLSTITDGVILVCAAGQSIIEGAKNAKALLQKVKANILGVVLTKVPIGDGKYYKYHYYSYYYDYFNDENNEEKGRRRKKAEANA